MSQPRRALISVSDKTGIVGFAESLRGLGFQLISTGGTAGHLREAGLEVTDVTALTGFPEIMDGRVKTLHPVIHGGLLGRRGVDDDVLEHHDIGWIDLLVVNLYPFQETISDPGCTRAAAIEQIDVGGPAMIRAAAKNHERVTVVVDPTDYDQIVDQLSDGNTSAKQRAQLAQKAFQHTGNYDLVISQFLAGNDEDLFPDSLTKTWQLKESLRYGENPHQGAAFYQQDSVGSASIGHATQLQGKPLSFNNIADADAALQCVLAFEEPACVIVKHANPCGLAIGTNLEEAYAKAFQTDPTSAFGGIIALNRTLDDGLAETILAKQFVEVILAPDVTKGAQEAMEKKKNVRLLAFGEGTPPAGLELRSVSGGLLVQESDRFQIPSTDFRVVTTRSPSEEQLRDLVFAWHAVRFVKSNAIVFCRDGATVGIGAGQMSRVISTKIAALKAQEENLVVRGAVLASDAFFPFPDSVHQAAELGIAAIIQPGGSIRDEEVIAAANEHDIPMMFTGERHFRH